MMAIAPQGRTIALIYGDEVLVRRNRIREKLASRGLTIKKEYASTSRTFDFSTVDLVVAVREGIKGATMAVEAAAERSKVEVVYVEHASSRSGWDRLDAFAPAQLAVVPAPKSSGNLDAETQQLFDLVEAERDEANNRLQKLTGEIGNVRADRDRLTKEAETLRGKVVRLETALEEKKLGDGELQEQRAAWTSRLRAMETARDAAVSQNKKLLNELTAAREALDRHETTENDVLNLRAELEQAKKERKEYVDKFRMSVARAARTSTSPEAGRILKLSKELTATTKTLDEANGLIATLRRELTAAETRARTAERAQLFPGTGDAKSLAEVATALRAVVKAKVMTADEAFERLADMTAK